MSLRLVIFDVDGTLVDSQGDIVVSMARAFDSLDLTPPARADILSIVGLSLPEAMARLVPQSDTAMHVALAEAYKAAYTELRRFAGTASSSPLYPGARAALDGLRAQPETLMALATGKSRKGVSMLIEGHGFEGYFQSLQCADDHPSKPHPSMIEAALAETGVEARDAVMVGDTTYDMQMAQNAGVRFVGVSWGYHPAAHLGGLVIDRFDALAPALEQMWSAYA